MSRALYEYTVTLQHPDYVAGKRDYTDEDIANATNKDYQPVVLEATDANHAMSEILDQYGQGTVIVSITRGAAMG